MKRAFLVVMVLSLGFPLGLQAADDGSPAAVVKALLEHARKNFGFSADIIKSSKEFVTPDLYKRLLKKANQPVAKGDAPDIEEDVFLSSQEPPTKVSVGEAKVNGSHAKVPVTLTVDQDTWHETVLLEQVNGAWKVSDIDYGKDGTLSKEIQ